MKRGPVHMHLFLIWKDQKPSPKHRGWMQENVFFYEILLVVCCRRNLPYYCKSTSESLVPDYIMSVERPKLIVHWLLFPSVNCSQSINQSMTNQSVTTDCWLATICTMAAVGSDDCCVGTMGTRSWKALCAVITTRTVTTGGWPGSQDWDGVVMTSSNHNNW